MIGLDTNVIVRYLTQDDPIQSARATWLIEEGLKEDVPGYVSLVAMAETVWVLDRAYGYSSAAIAAEIRRMLQIDVLVVEREQEVFTAMIALGAGRGEFADTLIGALNARAGCVRTVTFDRKALRLDGFEQI